MMACTGNKGISAFCLTKLLMKGLSLPQKKCLCLYPVNLHPRKVTRHSVPAPEDYEKVASETGSDLQSAEALLTKTRKAKLEDPVAMKWKLHLMSQASTDLDPEDSEFLYVTRFGSVRLDNDNKHHTELGEDTLTDQPIVHNDEMNLIDQQYFDVEMLSRNYPPVTEEKNQTLNADSDPATFIDQQYFGDALDRSLPRETAASDLPLPNFKQELNNEELNYIDEIFFKDEIQSKHDSSQRNELPGRKMGDFERSLLDIDDCDSNSETVPILSPHAKKLQDELLLKFREKILPNKSISGEVPSLDRTPKPNAESLHTSTKSTSVKADILDESAYDADGSKTIHVSKEWFSKNKIELKVAPDSALSYALKLRKDKKEKNLQEESEDGSIYVPTYKRIISSVLDLRKLSKYDLKRKLKDWIIYDDNDIVGIYKPYGLRAHGGGDKRWEGSWTLTDLMPELCNILDAQQLHHIHRLDANTSGVLLFGRTEEVAQKLRQMFKEHTIIKTYLAIVKNIPSIAHGLIDVPLKEGVVDGKVRMVLRPVIEGVNQRRQGGHKAVTKFKLLSCCNSAGLMSAQPVTGVKHQIRAHLGLVLNCPILADHKYSSSSKMVPQKLPSDILHRLHLKQSKVRDLPMMLHASSVFLPQFCDGKNIKISCPPPPHFTLAMKALKLSSALNHTQQKSLDFVDLAREQL
ncbi:uncharacterized protein LOC108677145 [Hyalella azteca]|uniref:Pseudouridylate synthase RPUSD4, mitochondrial n=1 Tax=Hyalella azteca TaxID=294128 RepID=A0A8B7P3V0_HYAAZ|nr:uncharacterized protein LOC108677145 [Hyalella azteca]